MVHTNFVQINKEILTPSISTRLYKTLQRSTLLYGTELADWDVDQLLNIEKLQAKALRSLLDLDLQCPKAIIRVLAGVEPFEARTDLHILLYYAKLCRSPSNSILGKIHEHRNSHCKKLPQGFHNTVWHTLTKYRLTHLWNTIPEDIELECDLKTFLKNPIWLRHWKADLSKAVKYDTHFSNVFLKDGELPVYPYKTHMFLTLLDTEALPRYSLSRVLRFWTTPERERSCSCGDHTTDISHHLLFNCRNTLDKVKSFASTLRDPDLIANFSSNNLDKFLI